MEKLSRHRRHWHTLGSPDRITIYTQIFDFVTTYAYTYLFIGLKTRFRYTLARTYSILSFYCWQWCGEGARNIDDDE